MAKFKRPLARALKCNVQKEYESRKQEKEKKEGRKKETEREIPCRTGGLIPDTGTEFLFATAFRLLLGAYPTVIRGKAAPA